jgi:signal peptide peptidase SppA
MIANESRVIELATSTPWAILPGKLEAIAEVLARHLSGERLSTLEIEARTGNVRSTGRRQAGAVAVLPLSGTIFPRANIVSDVSGGTSCEMFASEFRSALADPNVRAIVLDVDSPGGLVSGVPELSAEIFRARGTKPIVAQVNSLCASAAYWIASQADEIVVTPSGEVGSIGVLSLHVDRSAADEKAGNKYTYISAGQYKTEGNPHEPLSDEAREFAQSRVDDDHGMFAQGVARGRGVRVSLVRSSYGMGRVFGADEAVRLGMADRIGTLEHTIARLTS